MKLTLFFCAGAIHVETHTDKISEMAGIGKRMPLTMGAFAVAAAGMAGIPVVAGFVSKYFVIIGALSTNGIVFAVGLLLAGILNIGYFWPIVYTAFFESAADRGRKPVIERAFRPRTNGGLDDVGQVKSEDGPHHDWDARGRFGKESTWLMLGPILFVAGGSVILGVIPDTAVFLRIVRIIVSGVTGVVV
jgi:NADH-quinone oxidoreductase subunit L/multicomponent Na+:H+ antiporter subunit D